MSRTTLPAASSRWTTNSAPAEPQLRANRPCPCARIDRATNATTHFRIRLPPGVPPVLGALLSSGLAFTRRRSGPRRDALERQRRAAKLAGAKAADRSLEADRGVALVD